MSIEHCEELLAKQRQRMKEFEAHNQSLTGEEPATWKYDPRPEAEDQSIPSYSKPFFSDVDDTLILWDLSKYPDGERVTVEFAGYKTELVRHQKNINLLEKFARLGYTVIVYSRTGADWARAIVEALELQDFVHVYMDKPMFMMDDQEVSEWCAPAIWRDPKGEEK